MPLRDESPAVLVVEDCDEDFDTVSQAMAACRWQLPLRRLLNGDDCLALLRAHGVRPRMVLLDLNTPGIDGREALRLIKSDAEWRSLPVIVFSTSHNPRDLHYCLAAGANAYHVKPVRFPDHLALLGTLFDYWLGHALPLLRPLP